MKILLMIILLVFATSTFASGNKHKHKNHKHHHNHADGIDGVDGKDGIDGVDGVDGVSGVAGINGLNSGGGVSDDNFDTGVASLIALSNIDFSSSTQQWQIGIAAGTYDGEQALAFGVGKLIPKYDMLFKASGTVANDEMGLGVGLVWKIK